MSTITWVPSCSWKSSSILAVAGGGLQGAWESRVSLKIEAVSARGMGYSVLSAVFSKMQVVVAVAQLMAQGGDAGEVAAEVGQHACSA